MKQARPIVKESLASDLTTLIANVLDRDREEISPAANLIEDLQVDSVMRLEILVVLERTYGVKFAQEDLTRITSVNDMCALLLEKASQKATAT